MASDELFELKEAILAGAEAAARQVLRQRGIAEAPQGSGDRAAPGSRTLAARTFGTGYNSGTGTTTVPFTVDVSIVTDGTTGDIVTG